MRCSCNAGAATGHDGTVKALAVPDKLRGTATAAEAAAAICVGVLQAGWDCDAVPLADGGEGTLDVLGGPNRTTTVSGPLGDDVQAGWRYGRTAVIEMARASGLSLLEEGANDPMAASTAGTGELIAAAIDAGCKRVVIAVGGSATTDGGLGALRALEPLSRLKGIELIVACDVRTTFVDAARIFSPQKGATPAQVELLHRRLERLAQVYEESYGIDVRAVSGSGAAGGLAGGLLCAGARLVSGFDVVVDEVGLEDHLEGVDLLITGEGFLDEQSFEGKVVGGVVELGATNAVPVLAVVGEVLEGVAVPAGLEVVSLVAECGEERARLDTAACIAEQVASRLGR
jgi:glycerate kinase